MSSTNIQFFPQGKKPDDFLENRKKFLDLQVFAIHNFGIKPQLMNLISIIKM
jgi:hypothetical protein